MSVDYRFEKEVYMHGACHYFAIQAAEMFNGKVCLWLDRDYTLEEGKDIVLCHAYAKIADGFYVDAYGPFSDISQRENEFEFNELLTYAEQAMIESYQPKFNHIAARPTRKENLKVK